MRKIPNLRLNDDNWIPQLGFGTWQLSGGREATEAVDEALQAGYRLIDTAKIYGNEEGVGKAINQSGIKRSDLFVTTKLWPSDFGYDSAKQAFLGSIERLSLSYIDLYLIHWPQTDRRGRLESWRAMAELKQQGKVRSIGVSNFSIEQIEDIIEHSSIVPAVNQIELHPFIYEKHKALLDFCKKQGIVVEAYSPLARGRELRNELITEVAKYNSKTPAQVMLRWAIQHGTVPIPKSASLKRIEENIQVFDFELSQQEMAAIDGLGGHRSSLPLLLRLLK